MIDAHIFGPKMRKISCHQIAGIFQIEVCRTGILARVHKLHCRAVSLTNCAGNNMAAKRIYRRNCTILCILSRINPRTLLVSRVTHIRIGCTRQAQQVCSGPRVIEARATSGTLIDQLCTARAVGTSPPGVYNCRGASRSLDTLRPLLTLNSLDTLRTGRTICPRRSTFIPEGLGFIWSARVCPPNPKRASGVINTGKNDALRLREMSRSLLKM